MKQRLLLPFLEVRAQIGAEENPSVLMLPTDPVPLGMQTTSKQRKHGFPMPLSCVLFVYLSLGKDKTVFSFRIDFDAMTDACGLHNAWHGVQFRLGHMGIVRGKTQVDLPPNFAYK